MTDNYMVRRAIPDLFDKKYYIPEYQRGYRWEQTQVLDLLQDLYAFFIGDTKGQFYCLQPIVVKKKQMNDELWYEVIDGQQRLTTIRIIMQIYDQLNSTCLPPYHISTPSCMPHVLIWWIFLSQSKLFLLQHHHLPPLMKFPANGVT